MSFAADYYPEYPAGDDASFWDYATGAKMDIDIYGRALDDKGPRKIMSKEIKAPQPARRPGERSLHDVVQPRR